MKKSLVVLVLALVMICGQLTADTATPMNNALNALVDLIPYLGDQENFAKKENEQAIKKDLILLKTAFAQAQHQGLLKQDIFAPSLELLQQNLSEAEAAFLAGDKRYAHWRIKETTSSCMECHLRLPNNFQSSFQRGERKLDPKKFSDSYALGIGQILVRQYPDAQASLSRSLGEMEKKGQSSAMLPVLKQMLLVQIKQGIHPDQIAQYLQRYKAMPNLPALTQHALAGWLERLRGWEGQSYAKKNLASEKEVEDFITKVLRPIFSHENFYLGNFDVDLLYSSNLLATFSFEHPQSKLSPEIMYWLGLTMNALKRGSFQSSGDFFLKECILRYPKSNVAPQCLEQYRDNVSFEFTGSRGTDIPLELKKEFQYLEKLISAPATEKNQH